MNPTDRFTHPLLFEINAWPWLNRLSICLGRRVGLGDVPVEAWADIQAKGFQYVWLMGIWERSPESRRLARADVVLRAAYTRALPDWEPEDVVGSPYAVHRYQPDPHLGTWEDLACLRKALHDHGLGLILDFVPNHTARDHPWVSSNPEYYVRGPADAEGGHRAGFFQTAEGAWLAHGKDPYFPPWTDTAQVNYFHPGARAAMLREIRKLGQVCDGLRCDMAMLVLTDVFTSTWGERLSGAARPEREFWTDAVAQNPELVWIGEIYWDLEWRMQQLGFDFTYDKRLYDRLRQGAPYPVIEHLRADLAFQSRLVRFLENHDEPRSASVFGQERLPAVAVLHATLPGMRFYYEGQLEGKKVHQPIQLGRTAEEEVNRRIEALYENLLRILRREVFHTGRWTLLEPHEKQSTRQLITYQWVNQTTWIIVAVNLTEKEVKDVLPMVRNLDHTAGAYRIRNELTGTTSTCSVKELCEQGLSIDLPAYGSWILSLAPLGGPGSG